MHPGKCLVWSVWTINAAASIVFMVISMITFSNVYEDTKRLQNADNFKRMTQAACMMGFLLVVCWVVYSFFILIGRLFGRIPMAYGIMAGTAMHTGWFLLLAGLVLQQFDDVAIFLKDNRIWSSADRTTYQATYAFCFILCGTYLITSVVLMLCAGTVREGGSAATHEPSKPSTLQMQSTLPQSQVYGGPSAVEPALQPANGIPANHGFGTNWPSYGNNV